jgi:hypothetical protein
MRIELFCFWLYRLVWRCLRRYRRLPGFNASLLVYEPGGAMTEFSPADEEARREVGAVNWPPDTFFVVQYDNGDVKSCVLFDDLRDVTVAAEFPGRNGRMAYIDVTVDGETVYGQLLPFKIRGNRLRRRHILAIVGHPAEAAVAFLDAGLNPVVMTDAPDSELVF